MEKKKFVLTREGMQKMEEELILLKTVKRREVAQKIEDVDEGTVSLGCRVRLHDKEFDEDIEYTIVGSTESNPIEGRISNESPVGKALLGAKIGEDVEVETPGGVSVFTVLEINR